MATKSLADLRNEMRAVARGERKASPLPTGPLLSALTAESLELLRLIAQKRPDNVAKLVGLTGLSQPNISRSLQMLARHGLIRLVRDGREVRPELLAREVRVDLRTGTCETK